MTIELNKTSSRLEAIQFLSKSMESKSSIYNISGRFHTSHFKVEVNGNAVSTDGARLHFVENLPLEPEYYKVHKCTKSGALIDKVFELNNSSTYNGRDFPDYADILTIPNVEGFDVALGTSDNIPSRVFTEVVRAMAKSTVNFNFINDLCNVFDDVVSVIVPEPDASFKDGEPETCNPIHFVKNGYHAVIMPVRL